jgi:hypothetical protein
MSLPGFSAEQAVGPPSRSYRGTYFAPRLARRATVHPQQVAGPEDIVEPDLGPELVGVDETEPELVDDDIVPELTEAETELELTDEAT